MSIEFDMLKRRSLYLLFLQCLSFDLAIYLPSDFLFLLVSFPSYQSSWDLLRHLYMTQMRKRVHTEEVIQSRLRSMEEMLYKTSPLLAELEETVCCAPLMLKLQK